jgi:hypothetical protein
MSVESESDSTRSICSARTREGNKDGRGFLSLELVDGADTNAAGHASQESPDLSVVGSDNKYVCRQEGAFQAHFIRKRGAKEFLDCDGDPVGLFSRGLATAHVLDRQYAQPVSPSNTAPCANGYNVIVPPALADNCLQTGPTSVFGADVTTTVTRV